MMNHRGTVSLNIRLFRSAQKLYITSLNYRALMCMVYFLDLQHCSHRSDQKLYTKSQIYIAFMCMIYSLYLQNCCLICMYTWEHKVWAIYTTQPEALWLWIDHELNTFHKPSPHLRIFSFFLANRFLRRRPLNICSLKIPL